MAPVSMPALGVRSEHAQSVQRESVQSTHGARGVSVHTGFAWDVHAACGECAKSVSREGVCSACTKHTLSVHGVCGKRVWKVGSRVCSEHA